MVGTTHGYVGATDEAFGGEESDLFVGSSVAEDGDVDVHVVSHAAAALAELNEASSGPTDSVLRLPVPGDASSCGTTPRRSVATDTVGGTSSVSRRSQPKSSKKTTVGRWVRKPKINQRDHILYWLETKYDVLPEALSAVNEHWQEATGPDEDVELWWCDGAISVDRFAKMKPYQKVNHFVGMTSITRKNNLGRNLLRMKRRFPEEYRFFPDTWILPTDLPDFKAQFTGKRNKTFIVKPSDGCQGKGIFLTRDFENIQVDYNSTIVVQRYIHRPYLLQGHKFDLRLYVLLTGCDPLRIFLHERGLVRLASEEYVEPKGKNLNRQMMHLTNYAINCENPNFEENKNPEDGRDGHKRSLQAVLETMKGEGMDTDTMMFQVEELVIKTLVAVQPSLSHVYRCCQPDDVENAMCFEILGFDVMIDHEAKPWLIEVNHAPSFRTETELDHMVKFETLKDAFELLDVNPEARRRYVAQEQQQAEDRARGVAVERRTAMERAALEEGHAKARYDFESSVRNGYKRIYPRCVGPASGVETVKKAAPPGAASAMSAATHSNTAASLSTDHYDKFTEAAVDIWEMLTGSRHSRKQHNEKNDAEEKDKKPANSKGARRSTAEGSKKPLFSETTARASLRQRHSDRTRAGGSNAVGPFATSSLADDIGRPSPSLDAASSEAGECRSRCKSAPLWSKCNSEDSVGDTINVQTNRGWETVVVRKKYDSGHMDIEYPDGEMMRQVIPRILRRPEQGSSRSGSRAATVNDAPSSQSNAAAGERGSDISYPASARAAWTAPLPLAGNSVVTDVAAQLPDSSTVFIVGEAVAHKTRPSGAAFAGSFTANSPLQAMPLVAPIDCRRRSAGEELISVVAAGPCQSTTRSRVNPPPGVRRSYLQPGRLLPSHLVPEPQVRPLPIEARGLNALSTLPKARSGMR